MMKNRKIFKVVLIIVLVLVGIIISIRFFLLKDLFHDKGNYYTEYNKIKDKFSNMDSIRLINIWGNEDFTYENISVSLEIENKGTIQLLNLSSDIYNYPSSVDIGEVSGFLFFGFYCEQNIKYGHVIDIGSDGYLSSYFTDEFKSPEDVISRYDEILKITTDSIPAFPSFGHYFNKTGGEAFICTYDSTINVHNILEKESNLTWSSEDCIQVGD